MRDDFNERGYLRLWSSRVSDVFPRSFWCYKRSNWTFKKLPRIFITLICATTRGMSEFGRIKIPSSRGSYWASAIKVRLGLLHQSAHYTWYEQFSMHLKALPKGFLYDDEQVWELLRMMYAFVENLSRLYRAWYLRYIIIVIPSLLHCTTVPIRILSSSIDMENITANPGCQSHPAMIDQCNCTGNSTRQLNMGV